MVAFHFYIQRSGSLMNQKPRPNEIQCATNSKKKISGLIRLNETDKYLLLFQGINIVQANGLFANYMQSIVKTKPKM